MHGAVDPQSVELNGVEFTAQEEMHLEPGTRQHQAIEATNGAGSDHADTRAARVHPALLNRSFFVQFFYT
ncbi:hypothetical protein D3C86_2064360 [compost metagenome]